MTPPSTSIISRSSQSTDVQDSLGRTLSVRRLNALERLRLLKAAGPELSQNDAWLNMAALALSVSGINGIPRALPINERQIEAAVSELGDPGLEAVAEALNNCDELISIFSGTPEGKSQGTSN